MNIVVLLIRIAGVGLIFYSLTIPWIKKGDLPVKLSELGPAYFYLLLLIGSVFLLFALLDTLNKLENVSISRRLIISVPLGFIIPAVILMLVTQAVYTENQNLGDGAVEAVQTFAKFFPVLGGWLSIAGTMLGAGKFVP